MQLRPLAEYSAQPTISLVAAVAAAELACCADVEAEAEDPWADEDEENEAEADPLCPLCAA